ncbi:MAG TPA: flagellar assembly protein FliX, partial [Devosiaceae bacterium]|nr:flagellar assembly protein FliX [Devosiaceae bacterium]
ALQAVDDPLFARKKTVRRGHALLDALDAIKADLLVGRLSEGRLNRIVALVGQARAGADPTLEAIVDEIELRARVELAKLGVF